MEITAEMVRTLREKTGAGIMESKKALAECDGNIDKAIDYLRARGLKASEKKAGRATSQGYVGAYIHMNGRLGVLLELDCETDFVARNEDFAALVKDLAMHVAAKNPVAIRREDIEPELIERERGVYVEQLKEQGKPEAAWEKIIEGKFRKFYEETCLLEQTYVKDENKTVEALLKDMIAKFGENVVIRRFARYEIGVE